MFGISRFMICLFRSRWLFSPVKTSKQLEVIELTTERPRIRHHSFKRQKGRPHRCTRRLNSVSRGK